MGIFSFFSNWFGSSSGDSSNISTESFSSTEINPATGLPMVTSGGVDVAGNPYGTDLSDSMSSSSSIFDGDMISSSTSSVDDSWSTSSSLDDSWSPSSNSNDSWSSSSSFDDSWSSNDNW